MDETLDEFIAELVDRLRGSGICPDTLDLPDVGKSIGASQCDDTPCAECWRQAFEHMRKR